MGNYKKYRIKSLCDNIFGDMDSDSVYVTNEPNIVRRAKYCYTNYPTIVNKIKPGAIPTNDSNARTSDELLFDIDSMLCKAQRAIGESSNLAQIALSYTYTFNNEQLNDFVCILSVLAQVAIDSAKRPFQVDVSAEIQRIKQAMNVKEIGYPSFWKRIHPEIDNDKINYKLVCPMNKLSSFKMTTVEASPTLYDINDFVIDYKWGDSRSAKSVIALADEYRKLKVCCCLTEDFGHDDYNSVLLFMGDEYDALIKILQKTYLSGNAKGLMSILIREAFKNGKTPEEQRIINLRRTSLLSMLYKGSPATFLSCFKSKEEFEKELDKQ